MSNLPGSEDSNNFQKFPQETYRAGSNTTMDYYDSGYVYVEQLPLIKMSLTKHYGHELDDKSSVFYLNNTRTVIFKKNQFQFNKKIHFCII